MIAIAPPLPVKRGQRLFVELAARPEDVREAQRLRYQVFAQEMGAKVKGVEQGLDADQFDPFCNHLLVRESRSGRLIGCTRLLTDDGARRLGSYYSEGEFDIEAIRGLPGRKLEVGRTCITPQFRNGAGIAVLWSGISSLIQLHGFDYLFGCASFPLGERDVLAGAIMNRLRRKAMSPPHLRVRPRTPLFPTSGTGDPGVDAPLPALLKAYIRLGAKVCGEPCRDPDFGVADVFVLLSVDELDSGYSRHFLERSSEN